MNISNAQDMYTSLSDRLFNRKEKKLCHPNQFTLLNRLCLHFGSLQMPLFRSRFLSMFYNRGAVDKFGKRLTKTNCHYPILVNVFKFALKECSLSVHIVYGHLMGYQVQEFYSPTACGMSQYWPCFLFKKSSNNGGGKKSTEIIFHAWDKWDGLFKID